VRPFWWVPPNLWNSSLANQLVRRGEDLIMAADHTERQTERTTTEARAGVTGHNVRFVLAASLMGAIIVLAGLLYFRAF
jgi:hypothetical protein